MGGLLVAGTSHAAEAGPPGAEEPTAKMAPRDYSGRGRAPATAGEVALWIPRVLLSPLYLVTEYALRLPLSIAIPAAERTDLPRKVYDFFVFGKDHKAGIVPVGFVAFGLNPSVGLYAFWNDAGFPGHNLGVHAEAWPDDWYAGSLVESFALDGGRSLTLRVSELHRPDRVFYGVGPDTLQSAQSRYTEQTVDAQAVYGWRFWRHSRIESSLGLHVTDLGPGSFGTDPSLDATAARGAFPVPYGFDRGYTAVKNGVRLVVDSRTPWPTAGKLSSLPSGHPGSGLYLDANVDQGSDLRRSPGSGWLHYGGTLGGYIDLAHRDRVLGLAMTAAFVDPLGAGPVPFTELVALGGDSPMRGYYPGRLLGRSAAAATAHYVWPVAPWLGGSIEAAVGNVWGAHLEGFRAGRLRASAAIGLSTLGVSDYPVEFVVGCGSETFEHGGQIDSARAVLSVNHGF